MMRRAAALVLVPAAVALSGCGGSGSTGTEAAPSASPSATLASCPTPAKPVHTKWPAKVPADFPKPDNATIESQTTDQTGVSIVRFSTPTSLRDSVLFVVNRLPKAGYVLGRGDAEPTEADAPFVHGAVRGLVRMLGVAPCQTEWLLATVSGSAAPGGTSPLLPPHSPSGSPSPLPFG